MSQDQCQISQLVSKKKRLLEQRAAVDREIETVDHEIATQLCVIILLPPELLEMVVEWCGVIDALSLGMTCRTLYHRIVTPKLRRHAWITRSTKASSWYIKAARIKLPGLKRVRDIMVTQLPPAGHHSRWRIAVISQDLGVRFYNITQDSPQHWDVEPINTSVCRLPDAFRSAGVPVGFNHRIMLFGNNGDTFEIRITISPGVYKTMVFRLRDAQYFFESYTGKQPSVKPIITHAHFPDAVNNIAYDSKTFTDGIISKRWDDHVSFKSPLDDKITRVLSSQHGIRAITRCASCIFIISDLTALSIYTIKLP